MPVLRSSLRWKIALSAIVTTGIAIVSFARWTVEQVSSAMEQRERVHLVAVTEMLARDPGTVRAVNEHDVERVQQAIRKQLSLTPSIQRIEVCVNDADGAPRLLLGAGAVGPELLPSRERAPAKGIECWSEEHAAGYLVATPVHAGSDGVGDDEFGELSGDETAAGTLLLWSSREPIVRAITSYAKSVLPFGMSLLLLAMTLGVVMTTRMLRHLRGLTRAAESLGRGSRDVKIPVHGNDEIATLAGTFNVMVDKLETSRNRIEEQNRTLEQKVQNRTQELLRAYEELQSLDRAKDSFLSSVSHELRTPLTSIRSFAEILLDYGDEEDPALRREFLTIIKDESERLSRLINQVLDLAKIEAGLMAWELTDFDFRDLVRTSVRAISGLKREKAVDFVLALPQEEVPYQGDRDRLHQVMTNLLTNAWKFSPHHERVEISCRVIDGGIEVRVADRGPGVPGEQEKERIFDRFRQGQHSLTDKPDGTGLGLPISKEILCMHGGFIACADNPGGGALFLFLLPEVDPNFPRPIDESVADDGQSWRDAVHDPLRSGVFESSWAWAARNS